MAKVEKFLQDELKDQHQILTNRIIEKMEDAVKYEKPWITCNILPYNPVTGTKYRGINLVSLLTRNFPDPRFLTFKQMQDLSKELDTPIMVKKGEKGTPVFKAAPKIVKEVNDKGEEEEKFSYWRQIYAGTVFNASQLTGMPNLTETPKIDFESNEEVEKILTALKESTGLNYIEDSEGRAYYQCSGDTVHLPLKENFKSEGLYYRTKLHELGHATGHEKRLKRDLTGEFGSAKYAFEELVAELTSYFTGSQIGLNYDGQTHENHAAYLKSWLEALKKDKNMIFKAATKASKASEFLINTKKLYYGEEIESENKEENKEKPKFKM